MVNILQTICWEDQYVDFPFEERESRKEEARRHIDVLMHKDHKQGGPQPVHESMYLEPNEEGFYPGLEEAGRLDA